MKNKKGLSGIVTTLIIILLVLAAVGLIWKPISNMLQGGTGAMDKSALCTGLDMRVTKVVPTTGNSYEVTITRGATGPEQKPGVKLVFFSNDESSAVLDGESQEWEQLQTAKVTVDAGIAAANRVQINPVFTNENTGEEVICEQSTERKF